MTIPQHLVLLLDVAREIGYVHGQWSIIRAAAPATKPSDLHQDLETLNNALAAAITAVAKAQLALKE